MYNDKFLKSTRKKLRNNMPQPEQKLWYYLRNRNLNGYKFRRQYSVGNYILDFYCPKLNLAIEADGDSHFEEKARIYDKAREGFLKSQGIKVVRFKNTDISGNIEVVIGKILSILP